MMEPEQEKGKNIILETEHYLHKSQERHKVMQEKGWTLKTCLKNSQNFFNIWELISYKRKKIGSCE